MPACAKLGRGRSAGAAAIGRKLVAILKSPETGKCGRRVWVNSREDGGNGDPLFPPRKKKIS